MSQYNKALGFEERGYASFYNKMMLLNKKLILI
jgi:hypothetical protein